MNEPADTIETAPQLLKLNPKQAHNFWSKVNKDGPIHPHDPAKGKCWVWAGARGWTGYGHFGINGKTLRAHVVSFQMHKNKIEKPLCVCHDCDNPACINPKHLFAATHLENMEDREAKGRNKVMRGIHHGSHLHPESRPRGEKNKMTKTTRENVIKIRALFSDGIKQVELSKRFGISQPTISQIVLGKTWRHI